MMGFELLILVGIAVAVVAFLARRPQGAGPLLGSGQSAKEILDARLARGEIGIDEYKKLVETLGTR